jgi:hypothetical protein
MVASLQYYKKFTKSLIEQGFTLNPYDPCVANKTVEGSQLTICFHVDDCKLSHRSPKVIDDIIDWLRLNYESIFEDGSGKMKVSRGKIHEYLGMTLDFTQPGVVRVTMFKYIDEIVTTSQPQHRRINTKLTKTIPYLTSTRRKDFIRL